MQYFILVMLYTAAMLAIYLLLLRNRTQYQLARYYLLATAVLPFLFPLLQLPAAVQARVGQVISVNLPELAVGGRVSAVSPGADYAEFVWLVYGLIATILIARCLWQVVHIRGVIRRHVAADRDGVLLVKNAAYGPGSFGRYVFFPGDDIDDMVLAHEQAHVRLHHTRDLLLLAFLQAVAWPNLLLVWVRRELEAVHEFQADAVAGTDRQQYMQLLVTSAFHTGAMPLMHSFIIHPIKRRIMMLQKNKTTSVLRPVLQVSAALLVMLPAVMAIQSCTKQERQVKQGGSELDHYYSSGRIISKAEYDSIGKGQTSQQVMPEFPGGMSALTNFLASHVKYPEAARQKKIEGKVIVRFAVNDKGEVADPEVVRSPDASLSEAALAAVRQMPLWKPAYKDGEPVCVSYTLPVSFKLK